MKKTLVSALTTALVVGAASTTLLLQTRSPMYRLTIGLTTLYLSSLLMASSKAMATRRSVATRTSRVMRWLR